MMSFNHNNKTNCPCKDCTDRYPGCHDKCERFAGWKQMLEEYRKNEREYHQKNDVISDAKLHTIWKSRRYNSRVGHGKRFGQG